MPETSAYFQNELTLPDLLERAASSCNDLYIGYMNGVGSIKTQTYKHLYSEAKLIASGLFNLGLKQGDKIIIATQNNQETIELLWGCFLLGVVPTILQPPVTFALYNPPVVKLMEVYKQLNEPFIFLSQEVENSGVLADGKIKYRKEMNCFGEFPEPHLKPEDLAFIQFSSGSTGDPKGIMLTHRNLMVNMDAIRIGLDLHYPDKTGNWMPLFHDMGLIGYHLTPIYGLSDQYQIETVEFIMKPSLWLDLMGRHNIAITGGTNFALELVLRFYKRNKPPYNWDFSSMKALLNGAEPISVKIMQDFVTVLGFSGFRPNAMMPVYGMAEATLAISFTPLLQPTVIKAFDSSMLDRDNRVRQIDPFDQEARLLSGVGVAVNDVEIRILDENDKPIEDGRAGHIQIRGGSITQGYYNKPESTTTIFCGDWLRTGDMGFFFEGHLFVSGRHKDIIFKNGRNYFANDLENMACTLGDIKFGKVCFGAITNRETGHDKVIVFMACIAERKATETFRLLRALLRRNLGITVDEMVLIKSNEIPKTSSGKLQRYKLMQRYLNLEFQDRKISGDNLDNQ